MGLVIAAALLLVVLGVVFYNSYMSIYTWADHYGWEENSNPDKNAKILNITSQQVQYTRNGAKLKTKISFSDGFYFITYKTDRDDGFMTYRIYLSGALKERIVADAVKHHSTAVDKFISDNQSMDCRGNAVDTRTKKDLNQIKIEIVNDEKYITSEKDDRIEYLCTLKKQAASDLNKLSDAFRIENNKLRDIPVDIAKYIKCDNTVSLKQEILKLENKIHVIDELITLELIDKKHKKEYETLTKKLTDKSQDNKAEKVSIGDVKNMENEETYGWQYWD
mgnify:CR=1 FL=1